jgi:nucleoside-diphosphate-sugar epimerase
MPGARYKADDIPQPKDCYSFSKYEAEQALIELSEKNLLEVVIIRPPLVYGPKAKGNFATLLKWARMGVPLPLSAFKNNRRSLVSLHNLMDLIACCLVHPKAKNQIFLASDGEDLSTYDLFLRTYKALKVKPMMFYVPPMVLRAGALVMSKLDLYQRLCGSLQADISKNKMLLNWTPPISVDEGLHRAIKNQ